MRPHYVTELAEVALAPVVRSGAAEADFQAFYLREYRAVAGYCFNLVRDEEVARDLAQEAFTRLLTRWVGLREPRAYLFHVATNLARDRWRRATTERAAYAVIVASETPAAPGPDRAVRDAIERLPRKHREVVTLYYFADLPVPEVARVVRRPAGTVKRLLSEAREQLASTLGEDRA